MRIAVWHNLPAGGAKRVLYNHIIALKERGHYLEAWTTDFASAHYLPLSDLIREHSKPIATEISKINSIKSPLKRVIKTIALLKTHFQECVKEIEKENFDIIFANSCSISYMPLIGLFIKIPVIVYLGEPNRLLYEATVAGNIWAQPFYKASLKRLYRYYKDFQRTYSGRILIREEITAAKSCRRILVNSLYSRESILRAYGLESTLCYLGVDENYFNIDENIIKKPFVVGMGRISPAKNIEAAILVISRLPEKNRPSLKWISNGYVTDYYEKIMGMAKETGVDFIPMIDLPDDKLIYVLGEAAVMIYTPHLEPFGLAPIEANMSGTFVVAIAEGGVRESIQNGKNGFLVNGTLPDEMAKLIIPFCSDLKYARQMGLQAREYAVKFWNREQMADNIERELQSALS